MTKVQRELLQLLASRLFCEKVIISASEGIKDEAKKQGVLGLVDSCAYENIYYNAKVIHAHGCLYNILENIPYVIIKGYASAYYYREPYLRSMGDVDFLIHPEDMSKVDAILRQNGFVFNHETELHKCYEKNGIVFEAHKTVNGIPQTYRHEKEFVCSIFDTSRTISCQSGNMIIPDDYHEGLICLFHIVEHLISTGIGVRHLCDWACYISHIDNLDELLGKELKESGLWEFARLLSLVCVKYLNVQYRSWMGNAGDELLEQLIDEFLLSGNMGRNRKPEDEWLIVYKGSKGQVRQFFSSLASATKLHWPITDKCKFLIPVGCMFFGLKYLINIIKGKHEIVNFQKLSKEARKRNRMYRELRLFRK